MKKKIYFNLCAALLGIVLVTSFSTTGVQAAPLQGKPTVQNKSANINPFKTKDDYIKFFNENNVPKDKQAILLKKLDNHELWDAYNPKNVKQIPQSFYSFNINDKDSVRKYIFEDGSFIKIETQGQQRMTTNPVNQNMLSTKNQLTFKNVISPNGSSSDSYGCSYWDWKISKTIGTCSAWFYATFYVSRYGASTISNYYAPGVSGFGATGNPAFEAVYTSESTGTPWHPAAIRSYWYNQATISAGWGLWSTSIPAGSTCELWLLVGKGHYSISDHFTTSF